MPKNALVTTPRTRRALVALSLFARSLLRLPSPAQRGAQSFLGTIRGTVADPQGQVVQGATVLIIDEATSATRTLDTDAEGRYEAPNLQPGTYRVEVVTTNFKKFERTGVVLRAAGTALVDVTLDVGNINETVTVSADALNNITLESQAIARGLDEQQLHDLPRNSRDIQSFLLLNPNVVGGSGRHSVPRRQDLRRFLHPGRSGVDQRHLRHDRQLRAGLDAVSEIHGAVELLQRRIRRPGRRRRHDQARREQLSRHRASTTSTTAA